ncbi:MAG: undecaprenyldiphospho-muramoylpentapeptide beta-N-acetylglucosaminyltransferase [Verrucomicrobiota bacterium]|nr:undecaprenyldiphospho-muramoylpentapeptide beta-N-acetylglucosaminyltransferase [Verrucomicrobiota bacterium]
MTSSADSTPYVAIACGGTGGHLFPGLAVAGQLQTRRGRVALLISPKDIDQRALTTTQDVEIYTLPAVGLQNRNYFSFARSLWKSFFAARGIFKARRPDAVLAMGGFTSASPVLAAKEGGAKTFLHESNTVPGRANRFLARFVDEAFIGFPEAAARLPARKISVTGTPVRPQFFRDAGRPASAADCRAALGLCPDRATILIVGGSQGASGLNEMVLSVLPRLAAKGWQWLHLTGANDFENVRAGYAARGMKAVVRPFLAEMDLALGAATAAVSRAGASSLAEIAALRLPSLLVPFPAAAENHQFFNALAFRNSGAAKIIEQKNADPGKVAELLVELVENEPARSQMQSALAQWHAPHAAEWIAEDILNTIARTGRSERRVSARRGGVASDDAPSERRSKPRSQNFGVNRPEFIA